MRGLAKQLNYQIFFCFRSDCTSTSRRSLSYGKIECPSNQRFSSPDVKVSEMRGNREGNLGSNQGRRGRPSNADGLPASSFCIAKEAMPTSHPEMTLKWTAGRSSKKYGASVVSGFLAGPGLRISPTLFADATKQSRRTGPGARPDVKSRPDPPALTRKLAWKPSRRSAIRPCQYSYVFCAGERQMLL